MKLPRPLFKYLVFVPLCDILFMLSFTFYFQNIFLKSKEKIDTINALLSQQTEYLAANNVREALAITEQLKGEYTTIIIGILGILVAFFVTWVIFQGLAWYLLQKAKKRKVHLKTFALHVLISSAIAGAVFSAILVGASYLNALGKIASQTMTGVLVATLLVIGYLLFTAYAIAGKKKLHYKQALRKTILSYGIFIATLLITSWLMTLATQQGAFLAFAALIFLFLPSIAYTRYLIVHQI